MIPVSTGELIDKITILLLKCEHLQGAARANVNHEYGLLQAILDRDKPAVPEHLMRELQAVNRKLWNVEEAIRACEARASFDAEFVTLARQVYALNDRRAELKRQINLASHSPLVEEKSYRGAVKDQEDRDDPSQR
jgi:hypothetical protein